MINFIFEDSFALYKFSLVQSLSIIGKNGDMPLLAIAELVHKDIYFPLLLSLGVDVCPFMIFHIKYRGKTTTECNR